jgi:O-antigen ligase
VSANTGAAYSAEPQALLRATATAGIVAVALIFLTHWPTYNYVVLGGRAPLYYYVLPGLVALPLVLLQPLLAARVVREPLVWWFVVYALSGMAWLLVAQDFPAEAGQQWRLRVLACFFFCTILTACSGARLRPVVFAVFGTLSLAGALNWYDIFYPMHLVPLGIDAANPGRGAGLFMNANGAAAFVLMATIALLAHVPMRFRGALLLLMVLAVAPTFSRFGFIFAALLIVAAILLRLVDRKQILIILIAVPLILGGAVIYYHLLVQLGNENVLGRLTWFRTFGSEIDYSVRERGDVAARAWERFMDSPLIGHGIGATVARGERVGTHNMYLLLMAEQGLVGLALYLSLLAMLALRGWTIARTAIEDHSKDVGRTWLLCAFFLALYGMVSHNVLEEPHGMFLLAFIVAAVLHVDQEPHRRRGMFLDQP